MEPGHRWVIHGCQISQRKIQALNVYLCKRMTHASWSKRWSWRWLPKARVGHSHPVQSGVGLRCCKEELGYIELSVLWALRP